MRGLSLTFVPAFVLPLLLACSEDSKSSDPSGAGGSGSGSGGDAADASAGGAASGGSASGGASAGGSASGGSPGDAATDAPLLGPDGSVGRSLGSCTGVRIGRCDEALLDETADAGTGRASAAETACEGEGGTWSGGGCARTDLIGWCVRPAEVQYFDSSAEQLPFVLETACEAQQGTWHAP